MRNFTLVQVQVQSVNNQVQISATTPLTLTIDQTNSPSIYLHNITMPTQIILNNESLSYLLHHLQSLRSLSNKLTTSTDKSLQQSSIRLAQIKDQILQKVYLIEKKLQFDLQRQKQLQFEDFITQFYEQELTKVRKLLSNQKAKIISLQMKLKQASSQTINNQFQQTLPTFSYPNNLSPKFSSTNLSAKDSLSLTQQRQQSIKLRKQLSHCQSLIQQNQQFMNEQNLLIKQLSQQILQMQQKQSQMRTKNDQFISRYSEKVKINNDNFRQLQRQFTQRRKVYERQLKQLQIANAKIYQQNSSLQEQLVTKSDEIRLLTTKIYQLELTLNKYQRQLSTKSTQSLQTDEAILMLNKQMTLWKQKYYELQMKKKGQVEDLERERLILQQNKRQLNKELDELKRKINTHYNVNQLSFEKRIRQLQDTVNQKVAKISQLEEQLQEKQQKLTMLQQQKAKLQKQLTINNTQSLNQQQQIKQLNQQLEKQLFLYQQLGNKHNDQKNKMKKDIYQQVQELLKINSQSVKRVKLQEIKIKQLQQEISNQQNQKTIIQDMLNQTEQLNQQLMKRNNQQNKQIHQYKDIIKQLQTKLCQNSLTENNISNYQFQLNTSNKQIKEKQKHIQSLQTQLNDSIEKQQSLQRQLTKLQQIITSFNSESASQSSLTQQISLLKQQHCKKDFMIKQLQSKINLLQQELRQIEQISENQRDKMKLKIKQLQDLLKERYDFSNRPSNEG